MLLLAGCNNSDRQAPAPSPSTETASTAVPVTPAPVAPLPERLQALGTEPFWSFEIVGDQLRYTSPEQPEAIAIDATVSVDGKRVSYAGTLQGKPMLLTVEPGECSDGMSDTVYPYKATFTWEDRTERGCARRRG